MLTENSFKTTLRGSKLLQNPHIKKLLLFLCGGLFTWLHFYNLAHIPGLHFDEAWAMNFSRQIAFEPGIWPLTAMSPYTAPWAHYFAAIFMKVFSPSVLVFRLSQMLLAFAGMGFIFASIYKKIGKNAAFYFLLAVILLPGLLLNHRFAIELNGLHVFCFGGLIWAMLSRRPYAAASFFLLGATAHILFYSIGLGLAAALIWEKITLQKKERYALLAVFLLLSLFFWHVLQSIPEKGKGYVLVGSSLTIFLIFLLHLERQKIWRPFCRAPALHLIAAVFLANAVFFSEGMWVLATNTGFPLWESWQGLALFGFMPALYFMWVGYHQIPIFLRRWFLLSVVALGLMILKPAPRYYEWVLLIGAVFLALGFYKRKKLAFFFLPFLVLHSAAIYWPYFTLLPKEASLKLFVWKDSSRDFLSKQSLAAFLGGSGCHFSDIHSVDFRVKESLRAISYSSWPVMGSSCRWKKGVNISLASEFHAEPEDLGTDSAAGFYLWERK